MHIIRIQKVNIHTLGPLGMELGGFHRVRVRVMVG